MLKHKLNTYPDKSEVKGLYLSRKYEKKFMLRAFFISCFRD